MQYLWVVDGVQENLVDNAANGECTAEIDGGSLITDYSGWANRVWVLDSGAHMMLVPEPLNLRKPIWYGISMVMVMSMH